MPFGFPANPTVGQLHPVSSPLFQYNGVLWNPLGGSGVPATATPVTRRLNALTNTVDFIGIDGTGPALVAASVIADYVGAPPAATAPAALTVGQWSAEPTVTPGEIGINISVLPSDGGSPITALQYRVGTGAAIALTGTGTGLRVVTSGFSAGVAADIQVRAVNAVGAGPWSDTKTRTPLAGGGGGSVTFVSAGAPYSTISNLTAHSIGVPAGLAVGDLLVVCIGDVADATSITTDTGQSFTRQVRQSGAIWSLVIAGSVPATITVNYSTASDLAAQALAFRGATTLAGAIINDEVFSARATIPYTSDAASAAVICVYVRGHPNEATAAQFNGANAANHLYKVNFSAVGWFAGIHAGPTGANTIGMTWSAADTGGRYLVAAFRA